MTISAWWLLAAAIPVLMLGEFLSARIRLLARFDVPVSVLGGFVIAVLVLTLNGTGVYPINLQTKVTAPLWTWIVTPRSEWAKSPATLVYMPFTMLFFTCVGLNASWRIVRQGSWQLVSLLLAATVLGVLQNVLGVAMCRLMHQPPQLGLLCGSVTLTGGPSTAIGFAPAFEESGFAAAASVGSAAAMFGIVSGSFIGGAVGGLLIRRRKLRPGEGSLLPSTPRAAPERARFVFFKQVRGLCAMPIQVLAHLILLLVCVKLGASLTVWLKNAGVTLPIYMGALLIALVVRNVLDVVAPTLLSTEVIAGIASVTLGIFLAAAISSLNLYELKKLAGPMLAILSVQVVLMMAFAYFVTYRAVGSDYDAAVASAGHVGFGLGITANAVATMDVLIAKFGPAPRALLIVTIVGAFLIDFTNSVTVTVCMNFLK